MTINPNLYCLVETGAVVEGPRTLPKNWQDSAGNWHMNINNVELWSDTALLSIGWYPYVESDAGAPGPYYDRSLSDFVVNPTNVVRSAIYTQWDIERVRQTKDFEMEVQLREFSTNEHAINPKVKEYVRDDSVWYDGKQAQLARLTDWNAVAAFDTTKPQVMVLPNSYVGQSYVNQGLEMEMQNSAAQAQGVPVPWDPTELSNFVTVNELAANDPSDATSPLQPGYKLRQGIAVPSEQFNRIIIWREARDDPNPALRTTYKMQMRNRQDARNIYIFSYTNSTYLTWRLFEDQGNGVWGLEATPAEWQYVPGDMSFIFSYGANPAVQEDYFTEEVAFPAGVQEKTVLVAWDTQ